ncbi:neuromedin-K receptor-like [Ptychodera flava]|uniref:neuromedin-K receptor-like n=1 Tax=Ptychodera flava TaxID=63121 RepID=UPI00396A5316
MTSMSSTLNPTLSPYESWNLSVSWESSTGEVILLSFLYGIISFLSIFGNALVIFVIVRNKKMRTITNAFLINLAVADIILGFFAIPFQFAPALLQRWPFGSFMCPFVPFVKNTSVFVSIGTLTVISIDRYFAICHPLRKRMTPMIAGITVVIIWINGISTAMPLLLHSSVYEFTDYDGISTRRVCYVGPMEDDTQRGYAIYHVYVFIASYAVPLAVISIAYSLIGHRIWFQKTPGESNEARDEAIAKNKRKIIKMVMALVLLFAVCWLPLQMYDLLKVVHSKILWYRNMNIIWFCFNWLAMSNSAFNPFVYGLINDNFKREFAKVFKLQKNTGKVGPIINRPENLNQGPANNRRENGTALTQIEPAINQPNDVDGNV